MKPYYKDGLATIYHGDCTCHRDDCRWCSECGCKTCSHVALAALRGEAR